MLPWSVTIRLPFPCRGNALPFELQGIVFWASCQTRTGVPGLQIQNNYPTIRRMRLRSRLDSNQREWVCNPLPPVFLHHSATGPFLLSVRVTIPPPLVYQTSALPNELTDNFCSPGRLRSDSLHYVTVTLPRLSYKTILAGPVGFEPTSLCLTGRSFAHLVLQTPFVPRERLELSRPFGHRLLRPVCLPFHHLGISFVAPTGFEPVSSL